MENVIVYVIVAVIVIVNIVRTYQKEAKKNKERTLSQPPRPIISSVPTPFSRPRREDNAPRGFEYQNSSSINSAEYTFAEEGVSAVQEHINKQSKSNFKDDEHFLKAEDSVAEVFDLKLDTAEDFKRAFVHTLIFERKY